jgi:HPt (histidine-containing phosphotransfer) domain-containing protein
LAGSAPTYGFELLGKLAAEAEDSLEKLQNSQSNVTEVEAVILQLVAYKSIAPEK